MKIQKTFFKETLDIHDAHALVEINAPAAPDIHDEEEEINNIQKSIETIRNESSPNKVKPYTSQQGRIYWNDRDTASYLTLVNTLSNPLIFNAIHEILQYQNEKHRKKKM
ncbi:MAG: hypothetical protein EZS28_032392 [Streblomastix strix]|uniref:Uncharacterized protein n=1 Tax=Streblomastix strix TaxID=222440 RepID=A0A5J4UQ17_9EUKA|nr:MAG: hypothetical protein EZS28_032392 [Streblomastix strix]